MNATSLPGVQLTAIPDGTYEETQELRAPIQRARAASSNSSNVLPRTAPR